MPGEKTEQADSAPSQQKCQNHRRNYYRRPSRVYIFLFFQVSLKKRNTYFKSDMRGEKFCQSVQNFLSQDILYKAMVRYNCIVLHNVSESLLLTSSTLTIFLYSLCDI